MEQIFNSYTEIKGIDDEASSMKYKFRGYEICPTDTVESIGIVEYDVIECYEIAPPPNSDASTDSEASSDETTIADETDDSSDSDNDHGEEDGEDSTTTNSSSNNKRRKVSIDCQQSPTFHNGKYVETMKQVIRDSTDTNVGIDTHAQGLINMYSDKIDGLMKELPLLLNFISPILLDILILTSTGDISFHAEHMIRQQIFRLVVGESICKFDKASQYGTYIRVIQTTVGEFKDYVSTLCSDKLADHPKGASLIHVILSEIESYPDEMSFSRIYVGETSSQTIEVRRCQENNPTVKDGADMQWEFFQLMWGLVGEPFHIQISRYEPHDKVLAWKLEALVATLIVAFSNRTSNIADVEHHRQIRLTCHDGSGLNVINCGSPIWLENNVWSDLFKYREGGIRLSGKKKMMERSKDSSRCYNDEGVKKTGTTLGAKAEQKKKYRYECFADGCTNKAQKGGVCIKHGAKIERKLCSSEGCTNIAVKGGVCKKHGALVERKRCSSKGCTNKVVQGGVCMKHGAKVKLCSIEGCTKYAKKGGVCTKHGAKVKRCSSEGCTNQARKGGVCVKHGATQERKRCSSEGCTNIAQRGGVCIRHGANFL
jgi:hypothetical protein